MMKFIYVLLCLSLVVSPIIAVPMNVVGNKVQSYDKILKYVDTMKEQIIKEQTDFNKIYNNQKAEHIEQKKQLEQSSLSLTNIKKEVDASLKRLDQLNKEKESKLNEKSNIKKSLIAQKSVIKEELDNIERMYKEADKVKHYSDYKDIIKEINDLKMVIAKESKDITIKYKILLSKLKNTIATKTDEIGITLKTQKRLDSLYSNENDNHKRIIKSYEIFMNNYKKLIAKNKHITKSFKEELELLNDVYKFLTSNNCKSTLIKTSAPVSVKTAVKAPAPSAPVSVKTAVKAPAPSAPVSVKTAVKAPAPSAPVSVKTAVKAPVPSAPVKPIIIKTNKAGLTKKAIEIANKRDDEFNKWVVTDTGKDAVKFCRSLGIENKKDIFEGCLTDMLMTNDKNIAKEAIVVEDVKNNIKCVGKICNAVPTTSRVCVGSGDPHYINYDGEVFHIQEPGTYTLTRTNNFEVQEKMRRNGNVNAYGAVSCMTGVAIKYKNVVIDVNPTDYSHVIVNGKKQLLPEDYELVIGGVKVKYGKQFFEWKDKGVTTKALKIKVPNNFEVMVAEGYCGTVSIKAPHHPLGVNDVKGINGINSINGICGNADGIRDNNDYKNPNGKLVNVNRGKPGWENGNGGPSFPLSKWQLEWKAMGNTCLFSKDCESVPVQAPVPKVHTSIPKVPTMSIKIKAPAPKPAPKAPTISIKIKAPAPKAPAPKPAPKAPAPKPAPKAPAPKPAPKKKI